MGRRSGLKNAHFSSVPARMSFFTCKKYVFLIEKNFPNLTTPPKNRKNSIQRFPMGRVGKLSTTLSYGSRCGAGTSFTEDLS
ncbi:hypothetical protein LEP1GSC089_3793 [Leptospira interrogans serovar Autumnalis str. LP101]|nr:hypothetical protein LEP1GSC089_3793 [Leptospira interrogans serovar Autumnalis str. LP101]